MAKTVKRVKLGKRSTKAENDILQAYAKGVQDGYDKCRKCLSGSKDAQERGIHIAMHTIEGYISTQMSPVLDAAQYAKLLTAIHDGVRYVEGYMMEEDSIWRHKYATEDSEG